MGSGKSTVGKKVAKLLDRPFVDADVALVERTGRTVAEWFADGEAAFRRAEADLLAALLEADEPTVIAAGGGVVVVDENRKRLREPGVTVVLLDAEPAFLASRAKAKPHRPLLADDPLEVLTRLHAERDGWYREVADVVVAVRPAHEAGERPKWNLAEQIVTALAERGEAPSLDAVIDRKPPEGMRA
jgi:shikimate kinase